MKGRGVRRQDKLVDSALAPVSHADMVLFYDLRQLYIGPDGAPDFTKIAMHFNAACANQVRCIAAILCYLQNLFDLQFALALQTLAPHQVGQILSALVVALIAC